MRLAHPIQKLAKPSSTIRTVVILGAGGYLGSSLCHFFHAMPPAKRGDVALKNNVFVPQVVFSDALEFECAVDQNERCTCRNFRRPVVRENIGNDMIAEGSVFGFAAKHRDNFV